MLLKTRGVDDAQESTDGSCRPDLQGAICDVGTAVTCNGSGGEYLEAIVDYCKKKFNGKYFTPSKADFVAPEEMCDYFQRWLNGKLSTPMIMQVLKLLNLGSTVLVAQSEDAILTSRRKPQWPKGYARVILPSCHDGHWTLFCVDTSSREIHHFDSRVTIEEQAKRKRFQSDMKAHIKKCIHSDYRERQHTLCSMV